MARAQTSGLAGVRVAVTRPHQPGDALVTLLLNRGAVPVLVPLVAVLPAADPAPLEAAARSLADYDWIVFTSGNGVSFFRAALAEARVETAPPRAAVAAVGPATAAAIASELGWPVAIVPDEYAGAMLAAAMAEYRVLTGARVLWPRAADAREALPRDLLAAGALLDAPTAYRTVPLRAGAVRLAALLSTGAVDVVTLTSPSAAKALAAVAPETGAAIFGAIGPSTADAAADCGLPVHVVPVDHTIAGLVAALEHHLSAAPGAWERDERRADRQD